jgi:excisionase family DNA binding protein
MERKYTAKETAEIFGVTVATVYAWVRNRRIKVSFTPSGRPRISQAEVDRWTQTRID